MRESERKAKRKQGREEKRVRVGRRLTIASDKAISYPHHLRRLSWEAKDFSPFSDSSHPSMDGMDGENPNQISRKHISSILHPPSSLHHHPDSNWTFTFTFTLITSSLPISNFLFPTKWN